MSPENCFDLWLGFEHLEIYHCKHCGSVTLICSLLWGSIWVITRQSNLKCQGNITVEISQRNSKNSKENVDEPSGSQESKSVLNKTTTHILESEYMLYMYHEAQKLHKETVSSNSYNNCLE